ncbi:MAG TPA: hypothetical protein VFZ74_00550 [Burkholderiales bacterium]
MRPTWSSLSPTPRSRSLHRTLTKNVDERFQTGEEFDGAPRAAVTAGGSVDIER